MATFGVIARSSPPPHSRDTLSTTVETASSSDIVARALRASARLSPLRAPSSSRQGSAVVVLPNGFSSFHRETAPRVLLLTCAHVASFAGRSNALAVTSAYGSRARLASARVVGVSRALDLALCAFDDERDELLYEDHALEVKYDGLDDVQEVSAFGAPQRYAAAVAFASSFGRARNPSRGKVLGRYGASANARTHVMHDARVVSGMSGGALIDVRDGAVLGVHSFGDKFYGGKRDVAVVAARARDIDIVMAGVESSKYDSKVINEMIARSSDEALRALAPELDARTRANWIF